MAVVFSSPNFLLVAHFRALLDSQGIPSRIRNEFLGGAAGELPPIDCWPELFVEPRWEGTARQLIAEAQKTSSSEADWTCAGCGERIEGQFAVCWNCGGQA